MRRMTLCGLCVLIAGLSFILAAEPAKKEKPPKVPKVKIIYTFSNSGGGALLIKLEALATNDSETVYKAYDDQIPGGKSKHMTASVYDAPGEDFLVTVTQGSNVLINQHKFYLSQYPSTGEGEPFGYQVNAATEQVDFAYLNGELIWSVNPKHK